MRADALHSLRSEIPLAGAVAWASQSCWGGPSWLRGASLWMPSRWKNRTWMAYRSGGEVQWRVVAQGAGPFGDLALFEGLERAGIAPARSPFRADEVDASPAFARELTLDERTVLRGLGCEALILPHEDGAIVAPWFRLVGTVGRFVLYEERT